MRTKMFNRGQRLAALVLAASLAGPVWAEGKDGVVHMHAAGSELVRVGTPHAALFDISAFGDRLFAVGAGGQILRSDDGGVNWEAEQAPSPAAYLGVSTDGEVTVAVGQMGTIAYRSMQGDWSLAESNTVERLFDVSVNAKGVGVAVGAFGALLRTADGGKTWVEAAPQWKGVFRDGAGRLGDFFTPSLYAVETNENGRVWVAGELSLIMTSDDGGVSWVIRNAGGNDDEGIEPTISAINVRTDGVGYAVGQEGFVLKTEDFGVNWVAVPRPTKSNLLGVASKKDGTVVLSGMRDMRISRDQGRTFEPVYGNGIETGWFHGVVAVEGAHALAVGVSGKVLRVIN